MKILLAEDSAASRFLLQRAVEELGHECVVAEDGLQAWDLYRGGGVEVVISDWIMPGLDGDELCRRIRADADGDYYDLIPAADGGLMLLIADVAGHSIGSALLMAMARSVLRREVAGGAPPAAVLGATNEAMFGDLVNAGLFITMFCASYD